MTTSPLRQWLPYKISVTDIFNAQMPSRLYMDQIGATMIDTQSMDTGTLNGDITFTGTIGNPSGTLDTDSEVHTTGNLEVGGGSISMTGFTLNTLTLPVSSGIYTYNVWGSFSGLPGEIIVFTYAPDGIAGTMAYMISMNVSATDTSGSQGGSMSIKLLLVVDSTGDFINTPIPVLIGSDMYGTTEVPTIAVNGAIPGGSLIIDSGLSDDYEYITTMTVVAIAS